MKALSVRLRGLPVGTLAQDGDGRLSFSYDAEWTRQPDARPLSLSMPFEGSPFGDRAAKAFFGGYLPDESQIRRQIAEHFRISPNSPFQMLGAVGRDCAGALSLWPTDAPVREDALRVPSYDLLDEVALAAALRELRHRPLLAGPGRLRLSLAGAQSKTAVYVTEGGEVALTKDDYPSSHIVKPDLNERFADLPLIEHFCLELARRLAFRVPDAVYGAAEGLPYLLVARYDRIRHEGGRIERVHQEDFCQALGIPSDRKYENAGGPGLVLCFQVADRLRRPAVERLRLLDLVLYNFLIGNADAHGKNFSIVHARAGLEMAPLYDVVSTLVYEADEKLGLDPRMAMRIGKRYDPLQVRPADWQALAEEASLSWPGIRRRLDELSRGIQVRARQLERELAEQGRTTPILHRAVDLILDRGVLVRATHDLEPLEPDELPGRLKHVRFEERLAVADAPETAATEDERRGIETRYRRFMTRLHAERQRARLAARHDEDRDLAALGRELTAAYEAWRIGRASEEELRLLRVHLDAPSGDAS